MHLPAFATEYREMSYGGHNKSLQIRVNPAPQGCIGSTSGFEFEVYISLKMSHHV
jgi:hypothetical protein